LKSRFYHHPLLTDVAGEKFSKSAGATAVKVFLENGGNRSSLQATVNGWLTNE
jgi:glutamyl/glutaminyl-tRNA synthetase